MDKRLLVALLSLLIGAALAAQVVEVQTATIPPYSIEKGETGIAVDILKAAAAKAGLKVKFSFLPWARAQDQASRGKDMLILPLSRTPAREALFTWIAPLESLRNEYVLVALDPKVDISTLETARDLSVGVQLGTPAEGLLKGKGFTKIDAVASDEANVMKLAAGRIQAWCVPYLSAAYDLKLAGMDSSKLRYGVVLDRPVIWLAGSLDIKPALVESFRAALGDYLRTSSLEPILSKYR